MKRAAGILATTLLATWSLSMGETVVLQQGDTYTGCLTRTAVGRGSAIISATASVPTTWPSKGALLDDELLQLRGTQNHLLLKFDLPPALKDKKLARARLEVFVRPPARLNQICEITCRAVAGDLFQKTGPYDATDYKNARPAGVVDAYSIWEYNGREFPHKYKSLSVPGSTGVPPVPPRTTGETPVLPGKWIDFNITPLARKWLADPKSNGGVALVPVDPPDPKSANVALIDIPSATCGESARFSNRDAAELDISHRPRLVLEFEPLDKPYLVGMTHTLEKYCDRDTWTRFFGPFQEKYELSMARNEFEGFQVLVYPLAEPLKQVRLEWTDLAGPDGAKIPKADIRYNRLEVFTLAVNGKKANYFRGRTFDVPDPLIWDRPADLPLHQSTPFWFTVRTGPETKPGVYKGKISVKADNAPPRELELSVRVWNYKIPEKWNFQTMGQTIWANIEKAYGQLSPEMKRKYMDFLIDHRFNPVEQYVNVISPAVEDIPYCLSRGCNTVYLSGNYRGDADQLKQRYDAILDLGKKLQAAGKLTAPERLLDMSLVYIGDETSDWAEMRRRSDTIRRPCPELMIMIGGSYPRNQLDGVIDIYDPEIDLKTGVFNITAADMAPLITASQAKGERFFWYVCAGPFLPCPNVQMEEPLIACRALFWLTWKFGVTGFEYYCYNIGWENFLDKTGKKWPEVPFSPKAFKWGQDYTNGDGNLFYPGPDGPFSSIRFENIRDGIEDWESHFVLRDCVEALTAKLDLFRENPALVDSAKALLKKSKAILAVPGEVCGMDFVSWTWEPAVLLKARQDLGDTLDAMSGLVTEEEILAVREARKKRQLERQQAMLKARYDSAVTKW